MLEPHNNQTAGAERTVEAETGNELQQAGRLLADHHRGNLISTEPTQATFRKRLARQKTLLKEARAYFREIGEDELGLTYAAEWLLDNFYVIQRAWRQVEEDLPEPYYRQLPGLADAGPLTGYPRVFAVVRHLLLDQEAALSLDELREFVNGYQQVQPLTMGELWALPIMLRVVLLESLAQAAGRLTGRLDDEQQISPPFRLAYSQTDTDTIAAAVPALHWLASEDWKEFFEDLSRVNQILAEEPAALYLRMDFETRDRYRQVIEELAQASDLMETEVAQTAVELARRVFRQVSDGSKPFALPRQAHVGYYLLGEGAHRLQAEVGYRPGVGEQVRRWLLVHPTFVYLGPVTFLTLLLLAGTLAYAANAAASGWQLALTFFLFLLPATTVAVGVVNWLVTQMVEPHVLPKLDFSREIPPAGQTMVVIPALLTSPEEVQSLLGQLEQHYLRNSDPRLGFALLTDFADAETETRPEDQELLELAHAGLASLNGRYPTSPFYLFHRRRLYNAQEGVWMGWERKRGKLHEFNRLLRGARDTSYTVQDGDLSFLSGVHYVITLDADTILPRESAARLIGTIAHPLNRAEFAADGREIQAGYSVLQPRTEIQPASANQSLFTRIFAGDTGLDLYTLAVSDVYQDLFGEGIYVGKGIYDVDAFERSLAGRVPENTLLSHDLFEGIHGRAGLVTDVILYEEYPPHYLLQVRRSHRWVRGDWQLLPWLLPQMPLAGGGVAPNPLSLIDRWKIFDNLRRSLQSLALLLFFLAAWTVLPGSPLIWTAVGLLVPAVSLLTSIIGAVAQGVREERWQEAVRPVRDAALRWLLYVAFLPYEAFLNLDAILTTLGRLLVTRRNLLQWTTAAHTVRLFGEEVTADATWRNMISSLLLSLALALFILLIDGAFLVALPLILLWIFSPQLAHRISRPDIHRPGELAPSEQQRLRRLARRTWFFYEQFVGPEDNWLPPDHFQEDPKGIVAHRTSPTNTGLYTLSALAAYDFGYIDPLGLTLRWQTTFETLANLERHRGHFLNWINTQTLAPLPPRYVSTVDSGNLAGCLITVQQAARTLPQEPAWRWARWQGLLDTVDLLAESVSALDESKSVKRFLAQIDDLHRQVLAVRERPDAWPPLLTHLLQEWLPGFDQELVDVVETSGGHAPALVLQNCRLYLGRVHEHLQGMSRQMGMFLPWLLLLEASPPLFSHPDGPARLREAWDELQASLAGIPTLAEIPELATTATAKLAGLRRQLAAAEGAVPEETLAWCEHLEQRLETAQLRSSSLLAACTEIEEQANTFVQEMDFGFLYDQKRKVFHIGYNLDAGKLDENYYDLLASEARIASLVAIAKNDVPRSHWLHLARPVTEVDGGRTLLSWSGTMFEYLMPPLLLESYPGTLLNSSIYHVIEQQIVYAREQGVPWGISESGFYTFDAAFNYQYRAFGVPGLGFKRGLGEDLVITPYAALLALPFKPEAVLDNMDRLEQVEMMGRYGYYEAVDFTKSRMPLGAEQAIVRSYMAHHQGMILLALDNLLGNLPMVRRFHADPRIQSVELLLQEKIPRQSPLEQPEEEATPPLEAAEAIAPIEPWTVPLQTPMPAVHLLSNGRYHLLLTNAGAGYSRWRQLALTRWRPDPVQDDWGQWLYLQDEQTGTCWSAGLQPAGVSPEVGEVLFHAHKVEYRRHDHGVGLHVEVVVAPEDDVEIRQISVSNEGDAPRVLRLTSYAEVVLTGQEADRRHPAFAKLFVESEYLPEHNALLFRRRPRAADESPSFLAHTLLTEAEVEATGVHEGDRARFLGRNRTARRPAALAGKTWLSGTTGATLDPVMALGQRLELPPHTTVRLAFLTAAAGSRAHLLQLLQRYRAWPVLTRTFEHARTQAERELHRLDLGSSELQKAQQLLSLLLYPHVRARAAASTLAANEKGQPGLWAYGISGDYPLLLLRIDDEAQSEFLRQLLLVHTYWRTRGVRVDLVILNEQESNYAQALQGFIHRLIKRTGSDEWLNRRGGIFVINDDQIGATDRSLLLSAARVILEAQQGPLRDQLPSLYEQPTRLPAFMDTVDPETRPPTEPLPRPDNLHFDNGYGGFSPDGREYVIYLTPGESTPAPWINVIANPDFGFLVSESGGGYTWALNSGENRLTPWRNDPVTDMPAETLYLRDEETAEVWSPTPEPAGTTAPYLVRHGAGYSIFEHQSHGLRQELRLFLAPDSPVKIVQLTMENVHSYPRRLTATYYAELVLGTGRETTQQYIIPEYVEARHALLARNPYNVEFGERVAFLGSNKEPHSLTTDRAEFLGRLQTLRHPAGLARIGLEDRVEPGLDPCAAIQIHVELAPGASETVYFLLGQGANRRETLQLLDRFQDEEAVATAWEQTHQQWDEILGQIQVETPDPALDLLLNRWLLYQALSCRIWGRSALYQSSGAYGFRDQLQDVMSLLHTRPDLAREQIVRAARHQFEAGDVLHWWHPPSGRGVRTRIRDDLLWLPFVTARYISVTGDRSLLEIEVPFLQGSPLAEDEEERYGHYQSTEEAYTIFEHCRRALDRGTTRGRHSLPLIGGGDWNDGMNRVGIEGEGESIWLGWFLHATLTRFAHLCDERGEGELAQEYRARAEGYREALELNGWDGEWYRRAYYDDGTPLGSATNKECQIDAIAQSWAVISGAAQPDRARRAMASVDERLVRREERLLLLFTPPFDETPRDPGYIKGYLPGIRENGGQYTHAALWTIWAFAELGQGDKAQALFRLTNPIYRADTRAGADHYKVEPYVIVADVYGVAPHTGRGGWTWYTGSSGWMYRLGLEALLGVQRAEDRLWLDPRIPAGWPGYTVTYRFRGTCYAITVNNPDGVEQGIASVTLDGERLADDEIPLVDDGTRHQVVIRMG